MLKGRGILQPERNRDISLVCCEPLIYKKALKGLRADWLDEDGVYTTCMCIAKKKPHHQSCASCTLN